MSIVIYVHANVVISKCNCYRLGVGICIYSTLDHCWSFSVYLLSCKVDDGDSTISVGASSLSGSFRNSYSNNTCKPGTVGAK